MKIFFRLQLVALFLLAANLHAPAGNAQTAPPSELSSENAARVLAFSSGNFDGWQVEGDATWSIEKNAPFFSNAADAPRFVVNSLEKGEEKTGTLRSPVFTITSGVQSFSLSGWDGTLTGQNDGDRNFVSLRSHPDGAILRSAHTPGANKLVPVRWRTYDLIGRKVFLEVVDNNPVIRPGGFAWIAFAGYQQIAEKLQRPIQTRALYAIDIDDNAELLAARSIPFWAAPASTRGATRRVVTNETETIPIGAQAQNLYILGLVNEGWDAGVAHWGEHPELKPKNERDDIVQIGTRIGELEIRYDGGATDRVPLIIGATAWFVAGWGDGPTHNVSTPVQEPFKSRREYSQLLQRAWKIREIDEPVSSDNRHARYVLSIRPRAARIREIVIRDNLKVRGRPLVSGVTIAAQNIAANARNLRAIGNWKADANELAPRVLASRPGNWSRDLRALANALYTRESDLPRVVKPVAFPPNLDAARIRFLDDASTRTFPLGAMLTNYWTANLAQMDEKFESATGYFRETTKDAPWYGGYSGIGTWAPIGVYADGAFARTSDHYATLALRAIRDARRETAFVDFCDKWLYFYRADHDPKNGPPNDALDVARYPKEAPPHWSFVLNGPGEPPWPINELWGNEEMDGHGATLVGRWVAWRNQGAPRGDWLMQPRAEIYGKSRWDATRDAADFVCWLMDYTGRDVMWSEGESTGWGGGPHLPLAPPNMANPKNEAERRANYANANMFEPYPTWACLTALRCSAQIAEAANDSARAAKWRAYADRLQSGMIRLLAVGPHHETSWRVSPMSVFPSLQDSLVPAWFSQYESGLDSSRWNATVALYTRNTLKRQLNQAYGHAAVLGMGYGQGWLTHSALVLDEMDDAGKLLANLAKYSYDKNMDYSDAKRGLDWRKWLWLFPEGASVLPDGSWHRIGDLSNGANQGPAMHALEACAGIDDSNPNDLQILPRVPLSLGGLSVENFAVLVPRSESATDKTLDVARVSYDWKWNGKSGEYSLRSDRALPSLKLRLGPFADEESARRANARVLAGRVLPQGATMRVQSIGRSGGKAAWWLWLENMKDVSNLKIAL